MGIIKAFFNAVGGNLPDSWQEVLEAGDMSGSTVFYDVLMPLHKKILKYRKASVTDTSRAAASVAEHRAIYEAILSRDGEMAQRLISEHLKNAYNHISNKEN